MGVPSGRWKIHGEIVPAFFSAVSLEVERASKIHAKDPEELRLLANEVWRAFLGARYRHQPQRFVQKRRA